MYLALDKYKGAMIWDSMCFSILCHMKCVCPLYRPRFFFVTTTHNREAQLLATSSANVALPVMFFEFLTVGGLEKSSYGHMFPW